MVLAGETDRQNACVKEGPGAQPRGSQIVDVMKLWGKIILGRRSDTHKDSEMGMYLAYDKGQVRIPKVGCGKAFSFYTKKNEKPLNGCDQKEMFPGLYFRM